MPQKGAHARCMPDVIHMCCATTGLSSCHASSVMQHDSKSDQASPMSAVHEPCASLGQNGMAQRCQAAAATLASMQASPRKQAGPSSLAPSPAHSPKQASLGSRQHRQSFVEFLQADQHLPSSHYSQTQAARLPQLPSRGAHSARCFHNDAACHPTQSVNACNSSHISTLASTVVYTSSAAAPLIQRLDLSRCIFRGVPVRSQPLDAKQTAMAASQARQAQQAAEASCQPPSAANLTAQPFRPDIAHAPYHVLAPDFVPQQQQVCPNSPFSVMQAARPSHSADAQNCPAAPRQLYDKRTRSSMPGIPPAVPRSAPLIEWSQVLQQALSPLFASSKAPRPEMQQADQMQYQQELLSPAHGSKLAPCVPLPLPGPNPSASVRNSQASMMLENSVARHEGPILSGKAVPPGLCWPASQAEHGQFHRNEEQAQPAGTSQRSIALPASAALLGQLGMLHPAELTAAQPPARPSLHSTASCSLQEAMPVTARRTSSQPATPALMIPVSSVAIIGNSVSASALDQTPFQSSTSPDAQAWTARNAVPAGDQQHDTWQPSSTQAGCELVNTCQVDFGAIIAGAERVLADLGEDAAPGPATPAAPADSLNDFDFDVASEQFQVSTHRPYMRSASSAGSF